MKRILLTILLFISIFTITGCKIKGSSTGKESLVDLKYMEPKWAYNKMSILDDPNNKTISYQGQDDENKSINIYYLKGKDYEFFEDDKDTPTEIEINGTTWRLLTNNDLGIEYKDYYVVYNDGLYHIELNSIDKYQKEYDEFLEQLSFK